MNGNMVATWHNFFLLLALLISILASYTMFNFIGNLKRTNGTFRQFWLTGGAFVFGVGLWAKHFVMMLANNIPLNFTWIMPVALMFIIFFSLMAFVMLSLHGIFKYRLLFGSSILAFGIAIMNFFSILGPKMDILSINMGLLIVSLVVLFVGTFFSFILSESGYEHRKLVSSMLLGSTTVAMQLIGRRALHIEYSDTTFVTWDSLSHDINVLGLIIAIGALLILMSTLVTWYIDKHLNQMDERYRLLVENSLDTIAILKGDRWGFVNAAGLRMFEAETASELIGKSIYNIMPDKDRGAVKERLHNLVFAGSGKPIEQEWSTLKGKILYTEIVETMTTLDNEPAVQVIIRDISERKKNEELLINSEKLYVAGQLAAGIAHEIRNPLTSLKGFLQLIASGRKNNNSYYDIMNAELDRIEDIVSELLMLSKPQVYELTYQDMRVMMRDTVTLLETQAILHNIAIEAEYGTDPLWIYGVENQVKQVFINVIKNAIEAMTDGGAISIKLSRESDGVFVRIRDEGPGIDEEQLAKIGQPFYTTKEKGTGLGLMVSYKIVDNHQGKIVVMSELGKGTSFEIMLPFRYPEAAIRKSS
ncbi:PAS domain S-box protein [Cohnella endophytica]|uniref:histidine kinase n=1 Tax=Cohnella endophytica TaxID=2419778 RepID=A0A494XH93_9BACL|nr:ATP-binding protein [Cohnella endophytica]RKP50105.1 PAS domain S-box protein [Cohnella endophytica]